MILDQEMRGELIRDVRRGMGMHASHVQRTRSLLEVASKGVINTRLPKRILSFS